MANGVVRGEDGKGNGVGVGGREERKAARAWMMHHRSKKMRLPSTTRVPRAGRRQLGGRARREGGTAEGEVRGVYTCTKSASNLWGLRWGNGAKPRDLSCLSRRSLGTPLQLCQTHPGSGVL